MTRRNTYKGSSAKIPEIVMSRSLAKKTFIYFPSVSLLKNNPNQSANENVVQAAPVVGWGFVLTGGDARARLSYAQFAKAQVAWQQSRGGWY